MIVFPGLLRCNRFDLRRHRDDRRAMDVGDRRLGRDDWLVYGRGLRCNSDRRRSFGDSRRRRRHRFDRLDESGRRQHRRRGLRRFRRLLRRRRLLAFHDGRLGEDVAARQRDAALLREALDELTGDDFFNRARGALHLDAVIALEQRRDFLARRPEQFRDLVNPNCCQLLPQITSRSHSDHIHENTQTQQCTFLQPHLRIGAFVHSCIPASLH